ncbi:MAG: prephenate dehydrogenase [Candidatus Firestonebacteria bacterium]
MRKFDVVTIIGVGLIGGSIGLAIKKKKLAKKIIGVGRSIKNLRIAKKRGCIDIGTTDLKRSVQDAQLIVFATPVQTVPIILKSILPYLKKGCLITDAGSSKEDIIKEIERILPSQFHYVGAHPMAGSEKSGSIYASADLFKNAVCILTPTNKTNREALLIIRKFWESLGCKILFLSPFEHDTIISGTSHIPHLIACALVDFIGKKIQKDKSVLDLIGSGFKDTTRIALGDPQMWSQIFLSNRKKLSADIQNFCESIAKIAKYIKKNDKNNVLKFLVNSKKLRSRI